MERLPDLAERPGSWRSGGYGELPQVSNRAGRSEVGRGTADEDYLGAFLKAAGGNAVMVQQHVRPERRRGTGLAHTVSDGIREGRDARFLAGRLYGRGSQFDLPREPGLACDGL